MKPNYAIKPTPEQALRTNRTMPPARLIAALDVSGGSVNYDRPEWHLEKGFPKDLPEEAASTHIGMFLAWAVTRDLVGADLREYASDLLAAVRERRMTGRELFLDACDYKFLDGDLNEEGNRFASWYYADSGYLADYERTLARGLKSFYHVEDNWENYDRIAAVIDERFKNLDSLKAKPWWKFW